MGAKKPLVIVVLGPTASGKTSLSIEIAKYFQLEIQNIDSRQVYKGMDIGTAKPTPKQQEQVQHFLIDICEPNEQLNINEFKKVASASLNDSLKKSGIGLLSGGSGLYLKTITKGLEPPSVPAQKEFREQLQKMDLKECHQILKVCDPLTANKVSPTDSIRIIRALEVFYATGKPISTQRVNKIPDWHVLELGLNPTNLAHRIEMRTEEMYKNGLIEETEELLKKYGQELPLLKTIGYQEALCIIKGTINITQAIPITNQRTRNFAKRQRTWFKNQHSPIWLNDENSLKESISLIQEAIG